MINNRLTALIFRTGSFVFALCGILSQMYVLGKGFRFSTLMYYTIQSNILALVLFGVLAVRTLIGMRKDGKIGHASYFARFEMVCVVDLLLTLIVYWVLLAPSSFSMGGGMGLLTYKNLSVHLITPLLCMIDYILFTKPNHLKYKDVYAVVIFPMFYVIFSAVAGLLGYVYRISAEDGLPVKAPYFFLDYDRLGATSIIYIAALVVFFLIISHVIYWVDKKMRKPLK